MNGAERTHCALEGLSDVGEPRFFRLGEGGDMGVRGVWDLMIFVGVVWGVREGAELNSEEFSSVYCVSGEDAEGETDRLGVGGAASLKIVPLTFFFAGSGQLVSLLS